MYNYGNVFLSDKYQQKQTQSNVTTDTILRLFNLYFHFVSINRFRIDNFRSYADLLIAFQSILSVLIEN